MGFKARRAVSIPKSGISQPQELSTFWFLLLLFFSSVSRKTTGTLQQGQGTALPEAGARGWRAYLVPGLGSKADPLWAPSARNLQHNSPAPTPRKTGTFVGK